MDPYNGILPTYKDSGMTSHDLVNRVRRILPVRKVGHTGTLDPMASGLMMMTLGRATKMTQFLTEWDKAYAAEITLGHISDTYDGEGTLTSGGPIPELSRSDIEKLLTTFTGWIEQQVPVYSAVKVGGRELYKYAHKGVDVEAPSRQVNIYGLTLGDFDGTRLRMDIACSKGTYIRTLAHDIGRKIGCGAYLSALERTQVGPYNVEVARTTAEIEAGHVSGALAKDVIPIEQVLDFPVITLRNGARDTVKNGGIPAEKDILGWGEEFRTGDLIFIADESGDIMAIGKSKYDAELVRTDKKNDFFSYVRVLI